MRELLRRLMSRPRATAELLAATLIVNVFGFATPLFVMLILSDSVQAGFHGSLVTISAGMLLAMLLQTAFKEVRTLQAAAVSEEPDQKLEKAVFDVLTRARAQVLERIPVHRRGEMAASVQTIHAAYAPANVNAAMDAPFALLFISASWWLSPALAMVGLAGVAAGVVMGLKGVRAAARDTRAVQAAQTGARGMLSEAVAAADGVRAFRGRGVLGAAWKRVVEVLAGAEEAVSATRGRLAGQTMTVSVLSRVAVYAVGAKLVVSGQISFAALIVTNILVSRALRQVSALTQALSVFAGADQAASDLKDFFRLPLEPVAGTALRAFQGRLELRDVSFGFPGASGPLFESVTLALPPGALLVVSGANGAGKTTLARLLAGLLEPQRGEVLADGVNLRQLAPDWWRQQISYMPQEPVLLPGTLRENLLLAAPELPDEKIEELAVAVGLPRALGALPGGLDAKVVDGGRTLPLGARRRLALARALATGGRLAILDEPVEGLDADGAAAVMGILRGMRERGATIVVLTTEPGLLGEGVPVLDLDAKPVPRLIAPARTRTAEAKAPVPAEGAA